MVLGVGRAVDTRRENESGSEEIKTMTHGADAAVRGGPPKATRNCRRPAAGMIWVEEQPYASVVWRRVPAARGKG